MRSARLRLPVLMGLALSALFSACSADTDEMSAGPGKSYTAFQDEVFTAVLAYEKRCALVDASREAQRKTLFYAAVPSVLVEVRDQAAAGGRVTYDASCITAKLGADAPCSALHVESVRAQCTLKEAQGRLPIGRVCHLPEECQNSYCSGLKEGTCGTGTCQKPSFAGGACSEGGRACDATTSCRTSLCAPRVGESAQCNDSADCTGTLGCVRNRPEDSTGTCRQASVGNQGDPCDLLELSGRTCAAGLKCYQDTAMTYRCQPTIPVGMACPSSEACDGTATCVRKVRTDATGTCQALGKLGEACDLDPMIGTGCQQTLACSQIFENTVQCVSRPSIGEICSDTLPCLTGLCDKTQNPARCRSKVGTGLSCSNNQDCQSGVCDASRKCVVPACS